MAEPWVRVRQHGRTREGTQWVYTFAIDEASGAPLVVTSTEIVGPSFSSDCATWDVAAPTDLRVVARAAELPNAVLRDVQLRLGVTWDRQPWIVEVPLVVTFDARAKPDPQADNQRSRAFPQFPVEPPRPARSWPALKTRQRDLLLTLVDWERAGEDGFMMVTSFGGTEILNHEGHPVTAVDVAELADKGFIQYQNASTTSASFALTAEAHEYFRDQRRVGGSAESFVADMRTYVDERLILAYPEAAALLREATELLWEAQRETDVTPVGHKCREAVGSFARAYYARFHPGAAGEPVDRDKWLDMVSKVLRHQQKVNGKTDTQFADALFGFWRAVIQLDHKVEHNTAVTGRPLSWDDGRRAVLYSYLVIGELHRLAEGGARRVR